jgi:uncharacterized protein YjbI with pentapeptide repeats
MIKKDLKEFDHIYWPKKGEPKEEFTGFFDLRTPDFEGKLRQSDCMDGDFKHRIFKDCLVFGADFAAGCFNFCTFENCVFVDCAFVGVNFDGCSFKNTRFLNSQMDFSMGSRDKCDANGFGISNYGYIEDALRQAKLILGWPIE